MSRAALRIYSHLYRWCHAEMSRASPTVFCANTPRMPATSCGTTLRGRRHCVRDVRHYLCPRGITSPVGVHLQKRIIPILCPSLPGTYPEPANPAIKHKGTHMHTLSFVLANNAAAPSGILTGSVGELFRLRRVRPCTHIGSTAHLCCATQGLIRSPVMTPTRWSSGSEPGGVAVP